MMTAAVCETSYFYRVRAGHYNGQFSAYSNIITATTALYDQWLAALPTSASEISLTWADNSSNETAYAIERSSNGTTAGKKLRRSARMYQFRGYSGVCRPHYYRALSQRRQLYLITRQW
jgi:hypothetical protein